jgi:hypothetical protein
MTPSMLIESHPSPSTRSPRWARTVGILAALACASMAGARLAAAQAAPDLLAEQSISKQVVTVGSGSSSVSYLLLSPTPSSSPRPTVAVMLFAGGNGRLGLMSDGTITSLQNNFLVRTRMLFARRNLVVAVIDTPGGVALSQGARWTPKYAETMSGVIADLRARTPVAKIWVVGTSAGALAAVSVAGLYPQLPPPFPISRTPPNASRPDGVVLAAAKSSIGQTSGTTCTTTIFDSPERLPHINVPAYVAANRSDACPCSPPGHTRKIVTAMTASPATGMAIFPLDGTASPVGPGTDPCTAMTPHGFYGIEDSVVAAIVSWVKSH